MNNLIKFFLIISIMVLFPFGNVYSQQVTKEQLLKLFYEANVARNNNQIDIAIDAYLEILKLSPGLPDTYLILGDIYSTKEMESQLLEKACACYQRYLELKPEAEDKVVLQEKILALQEKIGQLRAAELEAKTSLDVSAMEIVEDSLKAVETELVVEDTVLLAANEPIAEDTILLAADELVVNDTIIKTLVLPADSILLGRWVSGELGSDGREMWILDIQKTGADYSVSLNSNSYIVKKNPLLSGVQTEKVQMSYETGLDATCHVERKKVKSGIEKKNEIGDMFGKLFNVNLNMDLFSDLGDEELKETNLSLDSVKVVESVISDFYQFHLAYDGSKLYGYVEHKVIQKDSVETLVSQYRNDLELFKAPDDYIGFVYKPLMTEAEKASDMEFRQLLNNKLQESMENATAANDLGCMYASGVGTRRDMKMAVACFKEASMKQSLFGILNMAQLYVDGLGLEKDLEKARELYKQAFEMGYSDAMVMCGDTYLISAASDEDYKKAFDCYLTAVVRKCPYAYYRLGWLYKEGLGMQKDLQKAMQYYQRAVDMQYPDALTEVGLLYKDGIIVEKNITTAMEMLMKAADKGNSRAMYELYLIFLRGDGVKQDFKYAKDWYHRSLVANDKVIDGFSMMKSQINMILSSKK